MNESSMGEGSGNKSAWEKLKGAVGSVASFGRDVWTGKGVDEFVNNQTDEGKRFVRTTNDIAGKWGVSGEEMRTAADTLADITASEQKKSAVLDGILKQAGINPSDPNYARERQNLEINMQGAVQTARMRRSKIGEMFSSNYDDER